MTRFFCFISNDNLNKNSDHRRTFGYENLKIFFISNYRVKLAILKYLFNCMII